MKLKVEIISHPEIGLGLKFNLDFFKAYVMTSFSMLLTFDKDSGLCQSYKIGSY